MHCIDIVAKQPKGEKEALNWGSAEKPSHGGAIIVPAEQMARRPSTVSDSEAAKRLSCVSTDIGVLHTEAVSGRRPVRIGSREKRDLSGRHRVPMESLDRFHVVDLYCHPGQVSLRWCPSQQ